MERNSADAWARRLERCRRSGLTTREFAQREGISARTLSWWRWKLAQERGGRGDGIAQRKRRRSSAVGFVELVGAATMATSASGFELEIRGGYRIRVPAQFEEDALERLLAVLEGR